jgi:hypothetical protein
LGEHANEETFRGRKIGREAGAALLPSLCVVGLAVPVALVTRDFLSWSDREAVAWLPLREAVTVAL